MHEAALDAKRKEDRNKRTFTQAGITVVTKSGTQTVTHENVQSLKDLINNERVEPIEFFDNAQDVQQKSVKNYQE